MNRTLILLIAAAAMLPAPRHGLCLTNAPFITGGSLDIHARAYYLDRRFSGSDTIQEAMALGGIARFTSASWHGLSFGLAPYAVQGLYTPERRDGTGLLPDGKRHYEVLGEAWAGFAFEENGFKAGRLQLDTPFINPYDIRMTPVSFEALTFESGMIRGLTVSAAHIYGIKGCDETAFSSPSAAAGLTNSNSGITMAGLVLAPASNLTLQAWNYYCHDFMNVLYGQADARWAEPGGGFGASLSLQAMDQRDVGDAAWGEFRTGMAGALCGLEWMGLTLNLGFTAVDSGHDIVNPWCGYPGYTSLIEQDCNTAGEKAWLAGLAFDFSTVGVNGLGAFCDHTGSWRAENGSFSAPAQKEYNITVDYRPCGFLPGLWLRARAARVTGAMDRDGEDFTDYRLIVNYDLHFPSIGL